MRRRPARTLQKQENIKQVPLMAMNSIFLDSLLILLSLRFSLYKMHRKWVSQVGNIPPDELISENFENNIYYRFSLPSLF